MILFIHFGIYKTGSSYLQYLCANNRQYLLDQGLYFPYSKQDNNMRAGSISEGNADGLVEALQSSNSKTLVQILKNWYFDAKKSGAKAVVISSEAIVHQIAIEPRLRKLIADAKSVGFEELKTLGLFRNLADHALSTYKHRSKTGRHRDHNYWILNDYETPNLLRQLTASARSTEQSISWAFRKFEKDSDYLKSVFFDDWLGVKAHDFDSKVVVNESVTLSEVRLLQHLREVYPTVIDFFVEDYKALSTSGKAKDKILDTYFRYCFINKLEVYQESLDVVNQMFRLNEKLSVGVVSSEIKIEPEIRLSQDQLQVLIRRIKYFKSFRGKLVLYRRYMISLIRTVK